MNIVIFRGGSRYDVLTSMAESLATALCDSGASVRWVETTGEDPQHDIERALAGAAEGWLFTFGSFGADFVTADGRSIYDAAGCGYAGWDVDHPVYQYPRIVAPIGQRVQVCASDSHFAFARKMGCRAQTLTMTPGVEAVEPAPRSLAERPVHLLAAMSALGEPEVWWRDEKGTHVYDLMEGIVGRMLADEAVDLLAAFEATCADLGVEVPMGLAMSALMAQAALFVRRYDRLNVAHTLAGLDVPRVICGKGWRDRFGERSGLHYADDLHMRSVAELYGHVRIVLNLNAANGGSERAVTAMGAGALVLSDYGETLVQTFGDQDALRVFDRRRPETLAETALEWLSAPEAQAGADRGHAEIAAHHLWRHKAEHLIAAFRAVERGRQAVAA